MGITKSLVLLVLVVLVHDIGARNLMQKPGGSNERSPITIPVVEDPSEAVKNQLIVGIAPGSDSDGANIISSLTSIQGVKSATRISKKGGIYKFVVEDGADTLSVIAELNRQRYVFFTENDQVLSIDQVQPNDPKYVNGDLWGIDKINAPIAWETTTGSNSVVVCVIDTGVDYTHEDLAPNMWFNPGETGTDQNGNDKATNGIDDDGNGYIDDVHGINAITGSGDPMDDNDHGTHCAGTVGGVGNNGVGVVGVNHQVSIMACKFLGASGGGSLSDALTCMDYALEMGATLTSNSWGGGGFSQAMSNLLDIAQQNGQIFVAAAGNSASNNDQFPHYPSSYPHDIVVAVASTTISDTLSFFSCYGETSVDLGAPGSNIWSTIPGNDYASFSGTSMATPHVAGAFAILYAVSPSASAQFLKQVVLSSGQPLDALDGITVSGKRLDVSAAIEALSAPPAPTPSPPAVPLTPTEMFGSSDFDLSDTVLTFTPDGTSGYTSCITSDITEYIIDPAGGTAILDGVIDGFHAISLGFAFPFYGNTYSTAYVGSNGYITFDQGDYTYWPTLGQHFSMKRISAMFTDFANNQDSTISWKTIGDDTVVVTWDNIRQFGTQNRQSFQALLSANGTVNFMYKGAVESTLNKIVGMSPGEEADMFSEIDFSETACPPPTPAPAPPPGANITCTSGMQSTWTTEYIRFMCANADGDNMALLCNGIVSLHRSSSDEATELVAVCQGSVLYQGQAWH